MEVGAISGKARQAHDGQAPPAVAIAPHMQAQAVGRCHEQTGEARLITLRLFDNIRGRHACSPSEEHRGGAWLCNQLVAAPRRRSASIINRPWVSWAR